MPSAAFPSSWMLHRRHGSIAAARDLGDQHSGPIRAGEGRRGELAVDGHHDLGGLHVSARRPLQMDHEAGGG